MRALRIVEFGRPLEMVNLPEVVPAPGEVLVEVRAAGICHSDVHYRAGRSRITPPRTPGHEVAGIVVAVADDVTTLAPGDRVALHYLVTCGRCEPCLRSGEQFCSGCSMLGKDRDGGYAERIAVPARNAVRVPDGVDLAHAAVMMCSTATALHALRRGRLRAGESLAIVGFGGLGVSALQLGRLLGAGWIGVVDVVPEKLRAAAAMGGTAIDARAGDATAALVAAAGGRGVDIALDFAGTAASRVAALRALAPGGRLVLIAIDTNPLNFDPFADVLCPEREIIGCSDHLGAELEELMLLAAAGRIDLSAAITRTVPFDADAVNAVLDDLERGTAELRSVITFGA